MIHKRVFHIFGVIGIAIDVIYSFHYRDTL